MNTITITDAEVTAELEVQYATYGKARPGTLYDPPEYPEIEVLHVRVKVLGVELVIAFDNLPVELQDLIHDRIDDQGDESEPDAEPAFDDEHGGLQVPP